MLSQILGTGGGKGATQHLNYFSVYLRNPSTYETEPHLESTEREHQLFAFQSSPAISTCAQAPILPIRQINVNFQLWWQISVTLEFRQSLKGLELEVSLRQTDLPQKEKEMKCEEKMEKRRKQQKISQTIRSSEAVGNWHSLILQPISKGSLQ